MEVKEPGIRAIVPVTPDHEHLPPGVRVHGPAKAIDALRRQSRCDYTPAAIGVRENGRK